MICKPKGYFRKTRIKYLLHCHAAMSTKGNIAKGFSASYDVLDVGEFIRFKDGSKLRQGADAQTLNESTGGSLAFGKPSTLYMLLWTA